MQPVRKVLSATHFKEVSLSFSLFSLSLAFYPFDVGMSRTDDRQVTIDTPEGPKTKLTPCSPGAPNAVEKGWTEVNSDELLEPLLGLSDFEKAIQVNRPTVSTADIQKHIAFTNESGMLFLCVYGMR